MLKDPELSLSDVLQAKASSHWEHLISFDAEGFSVCLAGGCYSGYGRGHSVLSV